jgi:methyl-accepting chemotaxis protein
MRFTIKLKLGLAFGLMILLLLGAAGYGMAGLSSMNSTLTALTSGPVARLHLADEVHAKLLELIGSAHEIIIETDF